MPPGQNERAWIDVVKPRADRLARARQSVISREEELAEAIRAALKDGHSASAVAELAGISRARVYQIRDGRR